MYSTPVVMNATGFHTRLAKAFHCSFVNVLAWVGPMSCELMS